MYEKLFMSAKFWHQDVRVSHLQKSTRTFFFKKVKTWTSTWHCLIVSEWSHNKLLTTYQSEKYTQSNSSRKKLYVLNFATQGEFINCVTSSLLFWLLFPTIWGIKKQKNCLDTCETYIFWNDTLRYWCFHSNAVHSEFNQNI